ncbi:GMC family oxidoreductase [Nocardia sp. NPDC059240]|uniref:GMC family oxidoreductase n=1 Tax=Nocardia sp. NPDC059240 TaxID=3346786 RepID=UPI0036AAC107
MASADYIVIGSGSAGAIIARRLADSGAAVTLFEAGGPDRSRLVRKPGMIGPMHSVPQLKKRIDWGHYTVEQKHALGRTVPQTHGKVVGGSSSVNGMVFVRGNRRNFDDWAGEGNSGWAYQDVLPSFKKFESFEDGASDFRGDSGPIRVIRAHDLTPASDAFMRAFTDTVDLPFNPDYNGAEQDGISILQQSNSNGLRYSTSVGYLDDRPKNLTVLPNTQVTRIVIENGRAVGVEYRTGNGGLDVLRAEREIIVSAGTFGSPQLLMLSGIGPADHLRAFDIDVVADLPVGDNLHDHLFVPMSFAMPTAVRRSSPGYFARAFVRESLRNNSTWLARSVFEAVAFLRTPYAVDAPDLQLHVLPWGYPGPNQDAPIRHVPDPRQSLTVLVTMIYPRSRGTLRLTSADPTAAPAIDPNYLAEQQDVDTLVHGMELTREVMAAKSISPAVDTEIAPGPQYPTRADLAAEVPNRATTVYHPVGTCRMGTDARAVVDPTLRVRGIEALRVADASIMPSIVGGNTNAATMMIGEHAASIILG